MHTSSGRAHVRRRRPAGLLATLLLAVLAVALLAPPASAHNGLASTTPVIRSIPEGLPDEVDVSIVPTQVASLLRVENPTDTPVEVLQRDGEPWLRISSAGVEVDVGLVDTYATTSPTGGNVPGEVLRGEREREWVTVSESDTWSWFEHRLHPDGVAAPRAGDASVREPVELLDWQVPLRYGDADVVLDGVLELRVPTGRIGAALADGAGVPEGVDAQVLPGGIPGVLLALDGAEEVVVLGVDGEPYLRFTADGVEVATGSPTHREVEAARGIELPVTPGDEGWRQVSSRPTHAWLEVRGTAPVDLPESVRLSAQRQQLVEWEVPLLVDGQEASLAGVTTWEPFDDLDAQLAADAGLPGWVPFGAVGVAVGLGALGLRSRRRTAHSA